MAGVGVFKRGKTWWYKFNWRGEPIRRSTKQGNERTARTMEAAHKTALAKGEVGIRDTPARVPTFEAFSKRFLDSIAATSDKPTTIAMYKTAVGGLLAFPKLSAARLDAVDESAVDAFKQWRTRRVSRRGRPYSIATINRELATLRRILGLAHEWKVINRIPRVRKLAGETGREFVVSYELELAYFGGIVGDYHDFATLLLDAGLRVGEALSLEWTDVRLGKDGTGHVTVAGSKAKNRKTRHVPLTPRLYMALRARRPRKPAGLVFQRDGEPLTRRWVQDNHDALRRLLKAPEFVPHSLRHTFCTRLGLSGADAFTIMRLAGHSSIQVAAKYVHPTPDAQERAIAGMAGLHPEAKTPPKVQGRHKSGHSGSKSDRKQTTYRPN
jgi:integrase